MATVKSVWVFNDEIDLYQIIGDNLSARVLQSVNFKAYRTNGDIFDCESFFYGGKLSDLGNYLSFMVIGNDTPYLFYSEVNGLNTNFYNYIDFGATEQIVSDEFYEWFTANATQQVEPPSAYKLSGTWLISDSPAEIATFSENVNFISNRENFTYMSNDAVALRYNNNRAYNYTVYEWTNDNYKIVDFGTTPQEVSSDLYEWFTANAIQQVEEVATATITYNSNVIATITDGQTATIPCEGKKMKGDIVIVYGVEAVNLISFTISGTAYQAEKNMEWRQWVLSEYNTGGYFVERNSGYDDGYVWAPNYSTNIYSNDKGFVFGDDIIVADYAYILKYSGN